MRQRLHLLLRGVFNVAFFAAFVASLSFSFMKARATSRPLVFRLAHNPRRARNDGNGWPDLHTLQTAGDEA